MKILYNHRTQGIRVERIHILGLVNDLCKLGHDVMILSPPGVSLDADKDCIKPKKKFLEIIAAKAPEVLFEITEFLYNLISYFRLRKTIRQHRFNMIYERYALFAIAGAILASKWKLPFILEVNDASFVVRVRPLFLKRLARMCELYVFEKADAIITVSEAFKRMIAKQGVTEEKIHVIPNAINPTLYMNDYEPALIRQKYGIPTNAKVIGFVGRVVPWHGLDILFKNINLLVQHEPNIHMLIVGDCSHMTFQLEEKAMSYITFTQHVPHDEIPHYLSAMDILVLPRSNTYGSPMKLFEYMASGKPVVAPRLGPITEIITDGVEGILFEPENEQDMINAILRSLDESARQLGDCARKKVFKYHTWSQNAERILSIYRRLNDSRRTTSNRSI
jgi:glycosyltransferase involved in cell wall biosynthesis